jgi:hypothetical protein
MISGTNTEPNKGIKGRSQLSGILKFPDDILIDSMHLLYLGIFKMLLKKWFDSKNSKMEFYIGNFQPVLSVKHYFS